MKNERKCRRYMMVYVNLQEHTKNTSISELELSDRVLHVLYWNGVHTIGELSVLTQEDLLRFRGIGAKAVEEINTHLYKYKKGLRKEMLAEGRRAQQLALYTDFQTRKYTFADLAAKYNMRIETVIRQCRCCSWAEDTITALQIPDFLYVRLVENGIYTITQLRQLRTVDLLKFNGLHNGSIEKIYTALYAWLKENDFTAGKLTDIAVLNLGFFVETKLIANGVLSVEQLQSVTTEQLAQYIYSEVDRQHIVKAVHQWKSDRT